MRFAYADPPYVGQAAKHYSHDPRCAEVNHAQLIATLDRDYDAWALSASSTIESQRAIVPHLPDGARTAAWVKPFASFKPGVNPAYAWEPVYFRSGRKRDRTELTERDWVAAGITLQRGLTGAKPDTFCFWMFALLGALPGDDFSDLFPGSGAVTRAWEAYCRQPSLFEGAA